MCEISVHMRSGFSGCLAVRKNEFERDSVYYVNQTDATDVRRPSAVKNRCFIRGCHTFSFWWRDVTAFKWSDKRRGSVVYSMIKQKSFTWHRAGCLDGVNIGVRAKRAKKLQKKHPDMCTWHLEWVCGPTSSSDTAQRQKASGVNCQSRKAINFRYENCYRLTIMDTLSRYIKVNVQLLFYTVVMHHCY